MNKSELLTGFNNHINEFFNDVLTIFPNDTDIQVAQTSLLTVRKVNPRLIISIWKEYIMDPYHDEISKGNIDFFINKNYSSDLNSTENASAILQKIDTLREPIKQMGEENQQKTITYIQNLTKLCKMYFQ
jgi:hypothetical protein